MELKDLGLSESQLDQLKAMCLDARGLSYSPYSKFRVGCTIVTSDNTFVSGANIENASYGGAICAERATICKAFLDGKKEFKVIAISGDSDEVIVPCGICRQFIREFGKDIPILMFSGRGEYMLRGLEELLPNSFGPESLLASSGASQDWN